MMESPARRECPNCSGAWGFHEDSCYEYTTVPNELTRPPGAEAFRAWITEAAKKRSAK